MAYTIFYSWQSDLENKLNRSFIEDILKKTVKDLSKNNFFSFDTVIDRDTYGLPGSPSIVESITSKIARSDIFVCDISIINNTQEGRSTPNPNVLYELGFASAILGWERIIMIQNIAFGDTEKLPFDLRGRRVLPYFLDSTIENKTVEKNELKQKLVNTLQGAFSYYGNNFVRKEKIIWWGAWSIKSFENARGGSIYISKVSSDAFYFEINIVDGERTGEIAGKAQILTPHSAYYKIEMSESVCCEILFKRIKEGNTWYIEIEESINCDYFHGANTTFNGKYEQSSNLLLNYLDEIDLNEIERITKQYLHVLLYNFQQIDLYIDPKENLTVITGGVKGLYTSMESIILLNHRGEIWCACLDPNNESIRYFSNLSDVEEYKPEAMKNWLLNFSDRNITENDENFVDTST